jgi:hypothetical protein
MTVASMLDQMTSSELSRWWKYYSDQPFDWDALQFGLANQTAWIASSNGAKATPQKCLLKFKEERREYSENDWDSAIRAYNARIK